MKVSPGFLRLLMSSFVISLVIRWSDCQLDMYDAPYANIRVDDCAPNLTRDHQRFLFTTYRALYDYRKYHHDYNLTEDSGRAYPKDLQDHPDNDGSVIFHNWQDSVRKSKEIILLFSKSDIDLLSKIYTILYLDTNFGFVVNRVFSN